MSEMVERVARAIDPERWALIDHMSEDDPAHGVLIAAEMLRARVVIMALDDPNEAMLHGARDWSYVEYGKPIGKDAALGCWHSMIEAALSEG